MDDYISREDALNFEMDIEVDPDEIQAITKGMVLYADYIKKVPAAEVVGRPLYDRAISDVVRLSVTRMHGEWISMMGHSVCNICGIKMPPILTNYCPNCGAYMREK